MFQLCFPLPACDPSLLPRGKSQNSPDAIGSHTKTADCVRRFLFLTYYFDSDCYY